MNRKLMLCAALALVLSLSCAIALGATANAVIVAPKTVKVTAPYAGTLLPFDLRTGDAVSEGDVLFSYDVTPIYAQRDGVVSAVFAKAGDDASGVLSHYGSLAVIEPTNPKYLAANTSQAYDKEENKIIHAGETVYLKYSDEKGVGIVTSVSGENYVVEIMSGDFKLRNNVSIYRSSGRDYDTCIGKGYVTRYDDQIIKGSGRIAAVHVAAGQSVKTGDLLFSVVDAQSDVKAQTKLKSPVNGAVTLLNTISGAQVYRGQLLCEIADLEQLELSVEVDEMDLSAVSVGGSMTFTLDAYGEETFAGTVTEIKPIGTKKQNASYFDVRLTLPAGKIFLPGMNATVTIKK